MNEVLDFINRRFKKDCNWISGNCYYFAVILKERFPSGEIYYDVIDGHFLIKIDDVFYDYNGINDNEYYKVKWEEFDEYDSNQKQVIIRDCIM